MGEQPAIQFTNVHKTFGRGERIVHAVNDVTFSVPEGEIFGFLGPNGAGKTTTIRCMMDIIRPTSGSVTVFGKDAQQESVALKQEIGYLYGNAQFHPQWTGQEYITYLSRLNGGSQDAAELIDRLGFDPTRKTKTLSSGNRQKLGIILSLMHRPRLIVMDEPTNALDPLLQQTVYALLEEARERGATVFVSSHNLTEVERLCNRVAIIKRGELVTTETIQTLREKRLYTVQLQFTSPVDPDNLRIPDVEVTMTAPDRATLQVKGAIPPVLAQLTKLPLHDIEVRHATLEELFLEYYQ